MSSEETEKVDVLSEEQQLKLKRREVQKNIMKKVIKLEKANYIQKRLHQREIISMIRKIVEDELK